jgi:starch synthase (maltosyl-transferring)
VKARDWDAPEVDLRPFITALNAARAEHPALRELRTLRFHHSTDDERVVVFSKTAADGSQPVLVVVNLDPEHAFEGLLHLDLAALGLPWAGSYEAEDALTGEVWTWNGPDPYVKLDPHEGREAHVLALRSVAA